jgi:hypothetical protein
VGSSIRRWTTSMNSECRMSICLKTSAKKGYEPLKNSGQLTKENKYLLVFGKMYGLQGK